jgi:hypothetical protein
MSKLEGHYAVLKVALYFMAGCLLSFRNSFHLSTGWTIGVLGFDSLWELEIIFRTASRTALGPTQPPIQWVTGSLSLGVKRPGREADH